MKHFCVFAHGCGQRTLGDKYRWQAFWRHNSSSSDGSGMLCGGFLAPFFVCLLTWQRVTFVHVACVCVCVCVAKSAMSTSVNRVCNVESVDSETTKFEWVVGSLSRYSLGDKVTSSSVTAGQTNTSTQTHTLSNAPRNRLHTDRQADRQTCTK